MEMNEKGKQFYEYLKSKNITVPKSYDEFSLSMSNANTAEQFRKFVKSKGITVPDNTAEFQSVFADTSKKKEPTESASTSEGGDSSLGSQTAKPYVTFTPQEIRKKVESISKAGGFKGGRFKELEQKAEQNLENFDNNGVLTESTEDVIYIGEKAYSPKGVEEVVAEQYKIFAPSKVEGEIFNMQGYTAPDTMESLREDLKSVKNEKANTASASRFPDERARYKELKEEEERLENLIVDSEKINNNIIAEIAGSKYVVDGEEKTYSQFQDVLLDGDLKEKDIVIDNDPATQAALEFQVKALSEREDKFFGQETAEDLLTTAFDIAAGIAIPAVAATTDSPLLGKTYEEKLLNLKKGAEAVSENIRGNRPIEKDAIDKIKGGDFSGGVSDLFSSFVSSSPYMAIASSGVGTAFLFESLSVNKYAELRNDGVDTDTALKGALGSAFVNSLAERVGAKLLGKAISPIKKMKGNGIPITTQAIKNEAKKNFSKATLGEAATEYTQEGTEYIIDQVARDKEVDWAEFNRRGMLGAGSALVGGGTFAGLGSAKNYYFATEQAAKNRANAIKKINTLIETAENVENESTKKSMSEQAKRLMNDLQEQSDEARKTVGKATPEELKAIDEFQKEIADLQNISDAGMNVGDDIQEVKDRKDELITEIEKRDTEDTGQVREEVEQEQESQVEPLQEGDVVEYGDNLEAEVVEDLGDDLMVRSPEGNEFTISKQDATKKQDTETTPLTQEEGKTVQQESEVVAEEAGTAGTVDEGDTTIEGQPSSVDTFFQAFDKGADSALDWIAKEKARVKKANRETLGMNLAPAAYEAALTAAELAVKAGKTTSQVIQSAKKAVSEYYKDSTDNQKQSALDEIDVMFNRPVKRNITQETEGLTPKQSIRQGLSEFVASVREKESGKRKQLEDSYKKKLKDAKEKLKQQVRNAKDDKESVKIFVDSIKESISDLNISPLSKSELNKVLSGFTKINANNFDSVFDDVLSKIQDGAKKRLSDDISKNQKEIASKAKKGRFGNRTNEAIAISNIDQLNIPDNLRERFNDLAKRLASKGEPDAKDLDDMRQFLYDFAEEFENQSKDLDFYADVYEYFSELGESGKDKFVGYVAENYSDKDSEFASEKYNDIKKRHSEIYKETKKKKTDQERINKIKEKRQKAIESFKNTDKTVDLEIFKNKELFSNVAAVFKNLKVKDLKDLTSSEIALLPKIYENLRRGMITPTASKIAQQRVESSRGLEDMVKDSNVYKRNMKNGVEAIRELSALIRGASADIANVVEDFKKLEEKFRKKNLGNLDKAVKGLKGTKLYEVYGNFTSARDKVVTKVNKFSDKIDDAFLDMSGNDLENTTLISIYLREREKRMNPNDNTIRPTVEYVDATLNANSGANNDKKKVLQVLKDKYIKDGKTDLDAIKKDIKRRGGWRVVELNDEAFNEIRGFAEQLAEIIRGKVLKITKAYSPRRTIKEANLSESIDEIANRLKRPSTKSGNIEDRSTAANALTFNSVDDIKSAYESVLNEYYVSTALSEIGGLTNLAKRVGNSDLVNLAKAIEATIDADITSEAANIASKQNVVSRSLSRAKNNLVVSMLSGVVKSGVDTSMQFLKTSIFSPKSLSIGIKSMRDLGYLKSRDVLDIIGSTHKDRVGLITDEVQSDIGSIRKMAKNRNLTTFEEILSFGDRFKGVRKFRRNAKNLAVLPQRLADVTSTIPAVIGEFKKQFKEITGEDVDFDKLLNDQAYRSNNRNAIRKARARADQLGIRVANMGTRTEKAIKDRDTSATSQIQGFMRSFPANERDQFTDAVKTIWDRTLERSGRENPMRGTFNSGREAARFIVGQILNQAGYYTLRTLGISFFAGIIASLLGIDDDEEEIDAEEMLYRGLGDLVMTNLFGHYGLISKLLIGTMGNLSVQYLQDDKDISPFFGISLDKYTYTPSFVSKFGAEGQVLAALMKTGFYIKESFEDEEIKPMSRTDASILLSMLIPIIGFQEAKKLATIIDKSDKKGKKSNSSSLDFSPIDIEPIDIEPMDIEPIQ